MRLFRAALSFFASVTMTACGSPVISQSPIRIVRTIQLAAVPSASGITASGDQFLVNSDNAPYLYVLNAAGVLQDSMELLNEDQSLHEIPKPLKSDYEAATVVRFESIECLLLLGSGSMSPHRDSALAVGLGVGLGVDRLQRKASLRPFYVKLTRLGIPSKSVNIEAAASYGDKLILFNRGDNRLVTMNADSFINALFKGAQLPSMSMEQIDLPSINGYRPGISGATMLNDSTILFCGSVEATNDWAKDGEILGSGIGMIRLRANEMSELLQWTMLKDEKGVLLREKLEGVELLRSGKGMVTIRCVTDNDNGSSTLMDLELRR